MKKLINFDIALQLNNVQRSTLHGREFLRVPVIMIVEGVLNGAYVPGHAIQACHWDGIPVTINHPLVNNEPASANNPEIMQTYAIGTIYNTHFDTIRRGNTDLVRAHAEAWIDIAQAQAIGGEALQVLNLIEANQGIEVSTGYFSDITTQGGLFRGARYEGEHYNIQADHLALLPNAIGACSWQDGCGCMRTNSWHETESSLGLLEQLTASMNTFIDKLQGNNNPNPAPQNDADLNTNQTDRDIRQSLYSELAREQGTSITDIFIDSIDMEAGTFYYTIGERLKGRTFTISEEGRVGLSGDPFDVQRITTYVLLPEGFTYII